MAKRPNEADGVHRPRRPQGSPFCRLAEHFFSQLETVYEERYQARYGFWRPIIGTVVHRFPGCGDLKHGFARVRSWKHSGLSVHQSVRLEAGDPEPHGQVSTSQRVRPIWP